MKGDIAVSSLRVRTSHQRKTWGYQALDVGNSGKMTMDGERKASETVPHQTPA
jgi:hypothetical protein